MKKLSLPSFIILILGIVACENRDVNEGEQFKPREIHEDIVFHFDTITVDGIEYLILEKDNNNPHEGFGFMAFRANKLMEKQDTVLAYLRTITDLQVEIMSHLKDQPVEEVTQYVTDKFNGYIEAQRSELMILETKEFRNRIDSANYLPK
ncbi:MAG: hypothetical protein KI791_09665 [Cyclobacteriaceae bacterium]|nr:hypothetical protein [Cyclobacteriaceae bacterium SS2]